MTTQEKSGHGCPAKQGIGVRKPPASERIADFSGGGTRNQKGNQTSYCLLAISSRLTHANKNSTGAEWGCQQATQVQLVTNVHRSLECHGPGRRWFFNFPLRTWAWNMQHCNLGFHCSAKKGQLCNWEDTPLSSHFSFILLICSSFMSLHRAWAGHHVRTPCNTLPNHQGCICCIQLEPPTVRPAVWGRTFC